MTQDSTLNSFLKLRKYFIFLLALSIGLSLFTAFTSHMNNWLIFKSSFFHLMDQTSLYIHYPNEHDDLFKYSPTFALFMAPLAILPAWLGALVWNLLGAILFIFALLKLPLTDLQRKAVFWISLPEFIGSTQGFQSNIHMVSLLALFWVYLESDKPAKASFNIWGSFLIKIFGVLGGCLFIFSTKRFSSLKKLLCYTIVLISVGVLLVFLPLLFTGWDSFVFQYSEWLRLLKMDAAQSYGFSIMGIVHGFTGLHFKPLYWQIVGGISLVSVFFVNRNTNQTGRLLGLIALCYFMVLFNHKSESPTFIIAMFAFGIHQSLIDHKKIRWGLIAFTLGCVSLMYSDLFRQYKQSVFDVYSVKAWPFLFLYPLVLWQMGSKKILVSEIKA